MVTNNGKRGGNLVGKPHKDKNGRDVGGIKAVVTDAGGKPVELEGGEVIINKEASKKHWKELSRINQSAGNGVPIEKPIDPHDEDPQEEFGKGGKIEFNANHLPNRWILSYAKKIKENHPEIWKLGGNVYGNEAFENLKRVSERGYWLDSEQWFYTKWRSFVARHKGNFRIEGVVAMLKWVDKVDKGWAYMKDLIEDEIAKRKESKPAAKMSKGGEVSGNCAAFIEQTEAIRNNGYFLRIKDLKNYVADHTVKIPKMRTLVLITYNGGGGKNLKSIDTINATELSKNLAKLLDLDLDMARMIVQEHIHHSERLTKDIDIEHIPVVIADRDKIVCHNIPKPNQFAKGGELTKGIKTEMEHANTIERYKKRSVKVKDVAKSIAKDHLNEDPEYYTKLSKVESKMADGGVADYGKVLSASSRFKPTEKIDFVPPLQGKNGAKLLSYTWAYEWTEIASKRGDPVKKRISDWTQAEESAETGRNIVHKYDVQLPDGKIVSVSSESVPVLLGFVTKEQAKSFTSLATAAKTLAKQQLQLAIKERQLQEHEEAKKQIIAEGFPEMEVKPHKWGGYQLVMGDTHQLINDDGTYDRQAVESLQNSYVSEKLRNMGSTPYDYILRSNIYDLNVRIERQKRKVSQMLAVDVKMEHGGMLEEGDTLPEDLERYFIKTPDTIKVPLAKLTPIRAREKGIANAEKYMRMAYNGEMDRRKPISIYPDGSGYSVADGNSTFAVATKNGWKHIYAEVVDKPQESEHTFAKGGKVDMSNFSQVLYREKEGNFLFAKNTIYLWLYDDAEAAQKLRSGEYDYVFFPQARQWEAFERNYVPPLLRVWTKKVHNQFRGSEKLIGIIEAWLDEPNKKLYVGMMTTRKSHRRQGIISNMIKDLRTQYNIAQEDVIFDSPTEDGTKVRKSKKYSGGGNTDIMP